MAVTVSLPTGVSSKAIGLEVWMDRVLESTDRVRRGWDAHDVHDLRVALRRCRTMADALSEVNPSSGLRKIKKASRDLFHALGDLRDAQVERAWVKELGPASDAVRKHMLRMLPLHEKKRRGMAERALDRFDRKAWKRLARKLASKARFFPMESIVFQRLALARLNAAVELYQKARRGRSGVAWHRLRIGLKRFRYVVENFLPQHSDVWGEDLKRMQDQLGDVHDLDVLRTTIRRESSKFKPEVVALWLERIEAKRNAALQEFLAKMTGPESPWLTWRAGFQWSRSLVRASHPQERSA
jgi:CHAD domain-containing protein